MYEIWSRKIYFFSFLVHCRFVFLVGCALFFIRMLCSLLFLRNTNCFKKKKKCFITKPFFSFVVLCFRQHNVLHEGTFANTRARKSCWFCTHTHASGQNTRRVA